MIKIKNEGIILKPTNLSFENKAVLNPACILVNGITHMFYRAISESGISSIGYCQLKDNKVTKRLEKPILFPEYDYEKSGVEDPRITLLNKTFYLFYTAFDGDNARIAYATSSNLINFVKKGLLSPNITYIEALNIFQKENLGEEYFIAELYLEKEFKELNFIFDKDALLFPEKINNQFALIHRIRPDIQIIYFKNFEDLTDDYWKNYLKQLNKYTVLKPRYQFENRYIGGGCPPIKTDSGWLFIYHGVENTSSGKIYHAAAALLDLKDPLKILGRLKEPLFSPEAPWEKCDVTNSIVFPTGTVVKNNRLYIYYGAADKLIGAKSVDLKELLSKLKGS